ncbi:Osteoclast-stimulating factor 1 [Rhizophlyctis rosea]|uniref:Osteoclast-stimulating factor 1 n=1 Tax=Rhizophlyctis rosea TaxID=64517 RepID=A0AAD5SHM7_9FUNG|nr:Osteoclast-stimulating factor 1 [Rhizophlyctis rosea]
MASPVSPSGPPPPRPSRPGKVELTVVQAVYPYTAQNPDELTFEEGAVLYVLDKSDPNWWKCRSGTKEGLVPSNYVGEHTQPLENPLHEASKRGNLPFALELLSAGSSPNSLDRAHNTPLHWAVRSGHVDVVRAILGCGKPVQVNAQNKLGDTAVHGGAWGGHTECVRLLLARPDINLGLKNKDNKTALDLAKNDDVASLLVNAMNHGAGGLEEDSDDD